MSLVLNSIEGLSRDGRGVDYGPALSPSTTPGAGLVEGALNTQLFNSEFEVETEEFGSMKAPRWPRRPPALFVLGAGSAGGRAEN